MHRKIRHPWTIFFPEGSYSSSCEGKIIFHENCIIVKINNNYDLQEVAEDEEEEEEEEEDDDEGDLSKEDIFKVFI